jgi:hypothetical protein
MDSINTSFLQLAASQLVQVTILIACIAVLVRCFARNRPHLAYCLWLIVLLKCVTPPIWSSPAGLFSRLVPAASEAQSVAEEISDNDEAHGAIMRRHFSVNYTDPELYDLVLNTQRISGPECIDQVLRLVRSAQFAETEAARERLKDLALHWQVRAALRRSPRTRDMRVTVKVEQGRVSFDGAGYGADERAALREVATTVPGVRATEDLMRTINLRARFA